jgi:hypothetical protein
MFDAQTSAFAARIEIVGRAILCAPLAAVCGVSARRPRDWPPYLIAANGHGGRPQGPFKIKEPSQNARKNVQVILGNLRVFLPKKFRIFFRALLREIIGESIKKTPKNTSKCPQKTCNL